MFYLKEMSYSFDMAEYNFIKSIPADENGYTNDFYNISMEEFVSKALPYFKDSHNGTNLKDGYVPETFFLMINDNRVKVAPNVASVPSVVVRVPNIVETVAHATSMATAPDSTAVIKAIG